MSIRQHAPYTTEQIERFVARAAAGASASMIAAEFSREFPGLTRSAISGILHRYNVKNAGNAAYVPWTPGEIEVLRTNWPQNISLRTIMTLLPNRTLWAIKKQLKKLRLHRVAQASSTKHKQRPDSPWQVPSSPKAPIVIIDTVLVNGAGKSIIAVRLRDCHYPIGVNEDGSHLFCGAPSEEDKPYCAAHCAICYSTPATRNWVDAKIRHGMAA